MRRKDEDGRITVVFHGVARTRQSGRRALTGPCRARKRRAVFGFRLSVSPSAV